MTDYMVIERRRTIAAPVSRITPLIIDFHGWSDWSPWEGIDPDMQREYTGPESGVGTHYEWSGNKKAGAGNMEITAVRPDAIELDLNFTRPFKSQGKTNFEFSADGNETTVTWQVHSPKTFMTRVVGIFMNFDKSVGGDLDRGLDKLKAEVEGKKA